MKTQLLFICMLVMNATMAQRPIPTFSLTAGTDFNGVATALGMECGIYTADRRQDHAALCIYNHV